MTGHTQYTHAHTHTDCNFLPSTSKLDLISLEISRLILSAELPHHRVTSFGQEMLTITTFISPTLANGNRTLAELAPASAHVKALCCAFYHCEKVV